ncbi:conserved exported hypothetical protein [uncultured Desulfatiglans sp.]|uniref:Alginate export domain-containing protein n=1 Tax=Uncultured Desulfatiglans sp. TaxID=1748965 RepID=A0A653AD04_UNCDX|nr:conserved exported hypothetical protein [uncultured Desulfatiglans sp.]
MVGWLAALTCSAWLVFSLAGTVSAGIGDMSPKSKDIEIDFFGSLKMYPTFMDNLDFNEKDTTRDYILDENGPMSDFTIRNEIRLGWLGKGKINDRAWGFMIILEGDFNLTKENTDRGADISSPADSGMTGEDFGIEKLDVSYDFGPFAVSTGWNTQQLDINTGGLLYGDDHPYISFNGKVGPDFRWQALFLSIFDNIENMEKGRVIGPLDADSLDWRVYALKGIYQWGPLSISPFYAFSDNNKDTLYAQVHYVGAEMYGKVGRFTPRFEVVWATGDTHEDAKGRAYDINAFAAYGSVDFEVDPRFIPYAGFKWEQGDDDPTDQDIDAFNSIGDIARYTPTFGMENAFLYRLVPTLGTHLYSGNFNWLPKLLGISRTPGYGGISNSSSGDAPGLVMLGAGAKGAFGALSYKAQGMYLMFDTADGLQTLLGRPIDDEVGLEFDLLLTYNFGKHFSIGNCFTVFDPGQAVQDIWDPITGNGNDETAIINTIEFTWVW